MTHHFIMSLFRDWLCFIYINRVFMISKAHRVFILCMIQSYIVYTGKGTKSRSHAILSSRRQAKILRQAPNPLAKPMAWLSFVRLNQLKDNANQMWYMFWVKLAPFSPYKLVLLVESYKTYRFCLLKLTKVTNKNIFKLH